MSSSKTEDKQVDKQEEEPLLWAVPRSRTTQPTTTFSEAVQASLPQIDIKPNTVESTRDTPQNADIIVTDVD